MLRDRARILVVEDEKHMREVMQMFLETEGYSVVAAGDGSEGAFWLEKEIFDLVITDIKMPGMDGYGILRKALEVSPDTLVIMITAFGTIEAAIDAMKQGAYDYIHKPFKIDEIRLTIRKALEKRKLQRQVSLLRDRAAPSSLDNIVAVSAPMKEIIQTLPRISESRANVLITGESGTGKDVVANAIHNLGPRREQSFVAINCATFPEGLLESELFGYMKGAFTGAVHNKLGLFEVADRGTLFLDEIADMPVQLQSKLLRAIETGSFRRVGGTTDITVDVRIISATNKDIKAAVRAGHFREDLYYRLNGLFIHIPPLRERREDIPALIERMLERRGSHKRFSKKALELLVCCPWRGNVRELENVIERLLVFSDGDTITEKEISREVACAEAPWPAPALPVIGDGMDLERYLEEVEKSYLLGALSRTGGRKMEAAGLLGLSFRSFRHRLAKYGIK